MAEHIFGATGNAGIPYRQLIAAMRKEGDELSNRLDAMKAFAQTEGFRALDPLDQNFLMLQITTGQGYLHLLGMRMARFDEAAKGVLPAGAGALAKKPLIKPN
jgi:hypothetical protein